MKEMQKDEHFREASRMMSLRSLPRRKVLKVFVGLLSGGAAAAAAAASSSSLGKTRLVRPQSRLDGVSLPCYRGGGSTGGVERRRWESPRLFSKSLFSKDASSASPTTSRTVITRGPRISTATAATTTTRRRTNVKQSPMISSRQQQKNSKNDSRTYSTSATSSTPVQFTSSSSYSSLLQPRDEYATRKQKGLPTKLSFKERKEVKRIQTDIYKKQQQQQQGQGRGTNSKDVGSDVSLEGGEEPSLEEMKRQLGFGGRLVADAVEVTLVTAGSYISGGMLGLVGGGIFSLPNLFKSTFPPEEMAKLGLSGSKTPSFLQKCKYVRNKSFQAGHSWATLSASFSGFHALVRCVRGGVEDRWTSILSSGCAGAFMSRQQGPQAMIRGAATFAGLTYIIDFIGGGGGSKGKGDSLVDPDFDFDDYPLPTKQ